jgi:hypothetical protein
MYLKCAHPDCTSDFDYGQGRLFRFRHTPTNETQPQNWHAVKHFWLCARCCKGYTIEYQKDLGLLLMQRFETVAGEAPCYYVLQPEGAPKPAPPRRVTRSRSRQRKAKLDRTPVTVAAIEVLENRNVERRGAPL